MKVDSRLRVLRVLTGLVMVSSVNGGCSSSKSTATGQGTQLASVTTVGGKGSPSGSSSPAQGQNIAKTAESRDYGYTEKMPIKCGGGPAGERRYLNSLRGPEGQDIQYERAGSCCPFETPNSEIGGMLDVFNVTWQGARQPLQLYLNMYDSEDVSVPVGLTAGK